VPQDQPADQADRDDQPAGQQPVDEYRGGGLGIAGARGAEPGEQAQLDHADAAGGERDLPDDLHGQVHGGVAHTRLLDGRPAAADPVVAWLEICVVGLSFPIKDGFPILVAEEAELPPGCESLGDLPCQKADTRAPGANKGEGSPRAPQQKDASTG